MIQRTGIVSELCRGRHPYHRGSPGRPLPPYHLISRGTSQARRQIVFSIPRRCSLCATSVGRLVHLSSALVHRIPRDQSLAEFVLELAGGVICLYGWTHWRVGLCSAHGILEKGNIHTWTPATPSQINTALDCSRSFRDLPCRIVADLTVGTRDRSAISNSIGYETPETLPFILLIRLVHTTL